ncbi:hypothetical protein MMC26_001590 [Xylographa opegraphella]|nr:hypothetical protein [Xylographa opegraphella]
MDPLSLTTSIVAVLQLTATVVSYLNDVKGASKERAQVAVEASMVYSLLTSLKYRVEDAHPTEAWYIAIRTLGEKNGALDQYQAALKLLAAKLDTRNGTKVGRALLWKFDKVEIAGILSKIERIKSLINVALTNDLLTKRPQWYGLIGGSTLSKTLKDDVSFIRTHVETTQAFTDIEIRQSIATWHWTMAARFSRISEMAFRTWSDPLLFWHSAGKTLLASVVVDYLQQQFPESSFLTMCIYCNYKEKDNQTVHDLLASLLKQLVQDCGSLSDNVKALHKDHVARNARLGPEDLIQALQYEIGIYRRVFIVVDALDECTEEGNRRMNLLNELRSLPRNVNVLVTSRHNSSIAAGFQGTITPEVNATDSDISQYIMARIQRENRLARHVEADPGLQQTIVSEIVRRAKGMFLLAQLHLDSLVNKGNRKAIHAALQHLPKGIDGTYDDAMARIRAQNPDDRELGEKVLLWISFALRPLSIIELQHALAVDDTSTKTDLDALPDEEILVSVCAGLIMVDIESGIVRLIHYTTQEYFDRTRDSHFSDAKDIVLATCITYLSFDEFGTGPCEESWSFRSRLNENAFLGYVANFWGYHARIAEGDATEDRLLQLLEDRTRVSCFGQVMFEDANLTFGFSGHVKGNVTGMHLATYFGISALIMKLWERGLSAESLDFMGRTPLIMAVMQGDYAIVEVLACRANVHVNAADNQRWTALHRAAATGQAAIVELLLNHNAEIGARTNRRQTPLHMAAEEGHFKVVELLIAAGGEVDALSDTRTTPLYRAARRGHVEVLKALLATGADVNLTTWDAYTALRTAVAHDQVGSVRILLSANPKLEVRAEHGLTALEFARVRGLDTIIKILEDAEDATTSIESSKVAYTEPLGFIQSQPTSLC